MYKVFVNDKPIILTTSLNNDEDYPLYLFKNIAFEEVIHKLKTDVLVGVYLYCTNIEESWKEIREIYEPIVAGGGLVLNESKEVLFIFRGEKWDLPKGRIEEGEEIEEAAIREVEEECGIEDVVLKKFLINTYHLFIQGGKKRLKETYWFLMHSGYKGELKPQTEEGITDVCFKNEKEIEKALLNTYANIKLVYNNYLKNQLQ
ncbi:NUDIX domain-containing protein [Tenacibaculum sp. MAR_2009_124]|uniref:NUDIX domain-containing protein n=1 Tax=Tenacibaculum sp. MAR_2009_124 TaxID=1250059 RepID=UPI000894D8A7|nr:NUDIX domain-containing protein [Tenacibaculum sp. MAR_2009_124]SEC87543.1 NUDIX domain-containing protein [Tenacibaculum sp. MAR_2009_124]